MVISMRSLFSSFHHMSNFRAAVFFSLYNLCSLRFPLRSSTIHTTSSFDQLSAPTNFCVLSSFFNFPLFSYVCFRVPTSGKTSHFRCQDLTSIFLHGKTSQTQFLSSLFPNNSSTSFVCTFAISKNIRPF